MKRFVEITRRSGNRIITQRYPARVVGSAAINDRVHISQADDNVCQCGFWVCTQTGPCAPKPAEQSRPCCTDAAKGAECGCLEDYTSRWRPEPTDVFKPALRPGWRRVTARHYVNAALREGYNWVRDYGNETASSWSSFNDDGFHSTLEAAQIRAEALARGEL